MSATVDPPHACLPGAAPHGYFGRPRLISWVLLALFMTGCHGTASHSSLALHDGKGALQIVISGLRNDEGQVVVSLFSSADGFPESVNLSLATNNVAISDQQAETVFHDIPYGYYAVSVLHDENLDGNMATSLFGVPQEGFGFSGSPGYRFGRPEFKDTSFLHATPERELELVMRYETGRHERQESARLRQDKGDSFILRK